MTRRAPTSAGGLGMLTVLAAVLLAAAFLGGLGPASTDRIALLATINVTMCIGLYVFVGNSGVLSFGHMAFAAIGAYGAGLVSVPVDQKDVLLPNAPSFIRSTHLGTVPAVLIGGLVAALFAGVVGIALLRLSGLAAGLGTLSLLLMVNEIVGNWEDVTRGGKGLPAIPAVTTRTSALVWALVAMVIAFVYQRTRWGMRLRATRDDEIAARSIGVSVFLERWIAWVLSAFVTGIAGALYAQTLSSISPSFFFLDLTFVIVAMLVIGGMASLSGAVLGAVSVSLVAEVLRQAETGNLLWLVDIPARDGVRNIGLAALMLVVLLLRPSGLTLGRELEPARWRFLRRRRRNHRPALAVVAEPDGLPAA